MKTVIEIWRITDRPRGLKTGNDSRVQSRRQNTIFLI